jgi:hypothetical protein
MVRVAPECRHRSAECLAPRLRMQSLIALGDASSADSQVVHKGFPARMASLLLTPVSRLPLNARDERLEGTLLTSISSLITCA